MLQDLKWPYAYDSTPDSSTQEIVNIDEAIRGITYYSFRGAELIVKQGQVIRKHFSYKGGNSIPHGTSASYEIGTNHDLLIDGIRRSGEITIPMPNLGDITFRAHSVEVETTGAIGNFIPDLTFYDIDGNVLCIIEVVVTHRCEEAKKNYIISNNILTIEITYDRNETDHSNLIGGFSIFGSRELSEIRSNGRKYSESKGYLKQVEEEVAQVRDSIREEEVQDNSSTKDEEGRIREEIKGLKGSISVELQRKESHKALHTPLTDAEFRKEAVREEERLNEQTEDGIHRERESLEADLGSRLRDYERYIKKESEGELRSILRVYDAEVLELKSSISKQVPEVSPRRLDLDLTLHEFKMNLDYEIGQKNNK